MLFNCEKLMSTPISLISEQEREWEGGGGIRFIHNFFLDNRSHGRIIE